MFSPSLMNLACEQSYAGFIIEHACLIKKRRCHGVILGVRTSPKTVRYAVLDFSNATISFINANEENKLDFPADLQNIEQKLSWFYQEMERVLRKYPSISKIVIKANEFGLGQEKMSSREAAYFDAIVFLVAGDRHLPVEVKFYRAIGTRRDGIKGFAETHVGKTDLYWNEQIADAASAAWAARDI
jgi:hypothetical protein